LLDNNGKYPSSCFLIAAEVISLYFNSFNKYKEFQGEKALCQFSFPNSKSTYPSVKTAQPSIAFYKEPKPL